MSDYIEMVNDSDPDFFATNQLPPEREFLVDLARQIREYGSVDFTVQQLEQMIDASLAKTNRVIVDKNALGVLQKAAGLSD